MTSRASELQERLREVRSALMQKGLGGLVAYYGAQHNMLRPDPIMLLTDHRALGPSALFVPALGAPTLVVTPRWDEARAREACCFGEIIGVGEDELVAEMARVARALPGPIAMIGTEVMTLARGKAFFAELGFEPRDGGDIVRAASRMRKSFELERVRKAAEIADKGFEHLCAVARPGMREYDLAAEVEAAMQSLGSEDNFGLIATGSHNVAVRAVNNRVLEAGDVVIGEITPCYKGYFAQLCRTFILGEPTDLQRTKFDMLIEAENAGLAVTRAGLPSSGIARAINDVIGKYGYADYCRPPYMRTRGHGLGLGGVMPADLTDSSAPILERDMTFVVHPNQYVPETGYLMLGDTIVVGDAGPVILTTTPQRLFWRAS
ncbi:MAG: Xaa-Pro peptidase family protein [Beijerinckiaceae bacterium]|nr:Xaa-Pro peptidase family protein [Beijerinckiaceae bacterium]